MATSRGRSDVHRYMADLPAQIERKLLRGAAKAGGDVIADEARLRAPAAETREAIVVRRSRIETGRITVKVTVKPGFGRSLGFWAEYGTTPHFISVADDQRGGMSVRRINTKAKTGTMVIGGAFVSGTVWHPGARATPFLRPALDIKEREAVAAAQGFINARVGPSGITGKDEPEGSDE